MTCWRRLSDWQAAGVFEAMRTTILAHCHRAGLIDFDRVVADGSHVRAKKWSADTGPSRSTGARPVRNTTY